MLPLKAVKASLFAIISALLFVTVLFNVVIALLASTKALSIELILVFVSDWLLLTVLLNKSSLLLVTATLSEIAFD